MENTTMSVNTKGNDSSVSNKPEIVLEPLYSRKLYSNYSHVGKCGGEWCTAGCWKHFCVRCSRGTNSHVRSCCTKQVILCRSSQQILQFVPLQEEVHFES